MSEEVKMWKTDDNKVWATEAEAAKHEDEIDAIDTLREIYFDGMIECVAGYYGIEE